MTICGFELAYKLYPGYNCYLLLFPIPVPIPWPHQVFCFIWIINHVVELSVVSIFWHLHYHCEWHDKIENIISWIPFVLEVYSVPRWACSRPSSEQQTTIHYPRPCQETLSKLCQPFIRLPVHVEDNVVPWAGSQPRPASPHWERVHWVGDLFLQTRELEKSRKPVCDVH